MPETTLCPAGTDHDWPAELDAESACSLCGLTYGSWSDTNL